MNNINVVKKKIEFLKKKEALMLYRRFYKILGEKYSADLIVGLVSYAWENKSPKLQEVWLQKATSFRLFQSLPQEN